MNQYQHDLRKFADTGLQLRLPVDLIPPTQYGQLTNALPIIEGEIRTRDGLTLIQNVYPVAALASIGRPSSISPNGTICYTIYPAGFISGQNISITIVANDPTGSDTVSIGTFNATVVANFNATSFSFTPAIPVTWSGTDTNANVFGQVVSGTDSFGVMNTTLPNTTITNLFRLNQSLPTLPTSQVVAMAGRLFRANLNQAAGPRTVTSNIITIQVTSNVLIVTLSVANPYPPEVLQFNGLTTATFLNGQSVLMAPYTPGTSSQIFGIFNHSPDYPPTADTGTVTGLVQEPPAFIELVLPSLSGEPPSVSNGFSGRPLSLIEFRFTDDSASWLIIADQNRMAKYRENVVGGAGYYFWALGNPIPILAAAASAGGAGNLNSTGGPGYDWRYTYHDGVVNSEGNPSPITLPPPSGTVRPTTFQTPDPVLAPAGSLAVANAGNAIDGSTTTFMTCTGQAERFGVGGGAPPPDTAVTSVIYQGTPSSSAGSVTLNVTYQVNYTTSGSTSGMSVHGQIEYSTDGGASFQFLLNVTNTVAQTTASVQLPGGVNTTQFQIRCWTSAFANKGATGSIELDLLVYDINLTANSSNGAATLALTNQSANVCVQPPGNLNDGRVQNIRLYRRGGSLPDAWRLVGTFALSGLSQGGCGAGLLQINDNVSDADLANQPILQLDNDAPVTSVSITNQPLSFIWGPVGVEARVMGCGDPNRPECVYFSKGGNADAWPPENFIEVSEPGTPIIAGCTWNNLNFAFSRERVYGLYEGIIQGATFTPLQTPSAHGLYTPWGLAVGPQIYFVAKDGIYETSGGIERSIVENDIKPLFPTYDTPGQTVGPYEAVDMTQPDSIRLRYHNDELYFVYTGSTTGQLQMLIYDILKKRWRAADYSVNISEIYSEPSTVSSLLMGSTGGSYYQSGGLFDPYEMGILPSTQVGSVLSGLPVTLPIGNYFAKVTLTLASTGESQISTEFGPIVVDATHAIEIVFPTATVIPQLVPPVWKVYIGPNPGGENQVYAWTDGTGTPPLVPANRQVFITAPGTPASPPTVNSAHEISVTLRTGAHDQSAPLNRKQYGNVIFDLDPGGASVAITPYINGEVASESTQTVTGSGRQQVPLDLSDFFAFNTEYQVMWKNVNLGSTVADPVLYQYDTLHFLEPAGVTHWQCQPTSFGFPGYSHVRDAYIAIRSNADVTLTVLIDNNTTQLYTVPNTGGLRSKVYIPFNANKGLLYLFSLDSTAEFRVYEEDIEFRVKPWLGLLGYQIMRSLGGESNA